ncbi:calcium-binding protein, partial [Halomonas ventosae]|uniref:calcium-binding protein n=1 Tax=Halomonas ventosae TaxID=229007 RepID=UPI0014152BF5
GGTLSYSYTLDSTVDNDSVADATDGGYLDSFAVSITDADGSSASAALDIRIVDDAPFMIEPEKGYLVNLAGQSVSAIPLDIDSNIDNNYGADQGGTISFAGIADSGTASELTASGSLIYLYTDGLTLVGSTLANSSYSNVASAENEFYKVFTVELNPDAGLNDSSDTYSLTLHQQIDGGASTFAVAEGGFEPEGGNSPYFFLNDSTEGDRDILLTPTETGSTVNSSSNDFATGTGMTIGGNEGIRIDFVTGLTGDPKQGPISYDTHYTVQGAGAIIGVKSGSSTVRLAAYDDYDDGISADPDDISIGNGDIDPITAVVIQYGEESLTVYSGTESATVGGQIFTFVWDDPDYTGQVLVGGVVDGTALAAVTDDGFSSLEFHYDAGTAFTVNSFSGVAVTPGQAVDFALDLNLTDADGDTALIEDAISLQLSPDDHLIEMGTDNDDTLDAGTDQASTLVGLAGDDALSGDSGDDILVGGPGNESLAGGAGADTFVWNFGDQGTSTDPAEDTVTDFTSAQGDVLDVSDLLSNMSDVADLSGYIQAEESGSDTILYISSEGSLTADDVSAADQTILLSNVDMGEMDSTQFLQSLINEGQLDIE